MTMKAICTTSAQLVTLTLLMAVATASAGQPTARDDRLALAAQLVELQRLEAFYEAEWEFQMELMEGEMQDQPEVDWGIPEGYMEVLREQQVDGQVSDWIEAWAQALDAEQLRQRIVFLQQPDAQAWVADRLEAYPFFLEAMATRAEAVMEVLVEDAAGAVADEGKTPMALADLPPVVDTGLDEVLSFVPGARVEASLDSEYGERVRVPAKHAAIVEVFADLEVQLVPDGQENARVSRVTGERGFAGTRACQEALAGLETALVKHFPDSETTDCGTVRYLAAGGDIRMNLSCRDQKALGGSRLRLSVTHQPTQDAMHQRFMTQVERTSADAGAAETDPAQSAED
ncbi:MAG: hypothetical protein HND55_12500 [Pseudomonadota bacterium]|nr:MAG: hypothetical protein HND55_12500 [Pseudomonadota bacterium]